MCTRLGLCLFVFFLDTDSNPELLSQNIGTITIFYWNETQQITYLLFDYIRNKGSVPLFWPLQRTK